MSSELNQIRSMPYEATLPLRLVLVSRLPMLHGELRPLWSLIDLVHLGRQDKLAKLTFGNTLSNIKGK